MSVFEGAGQKAGLELWRIENFEAVKQPECSGKFHVGDSYLVLKTNEKGFALHFWIGNETSQDELGAVAYKAVELDAFLGGGREDCSFSCIYISFPSSPPSHQNHHHYHHHHCMIGPVQYRETQDCESSLFQSYFKNTGKAPTNLIPIHLLSSCSSLSYPHPSSIFISYTYTHIHIYIYIDVILTRVSHRWSTVSPRRSSVRLQASHSRCL